MRIKLRICIGLAVALTSTVCMGSVRYLPGNVEAEISLKVPGNEAVDYQLHPEKLENNYFDYQMCGNDKLPVTVFHRVQERDGHMLLTVRLTAAEDVYFNYRQSLLTGYRHEDCQFYMPGFWYRRNLRSPKEAPSFHTSDSWLVREDRLSAPLTGIFSEKDKKFMIVNRLDDFAVDALSTHKEGEVILSGKTSLGFTGFENKQGVSVLSFGFPYREAPKSYIRKLTLAPAVTAYQHL